MSTNGMTSWAADLANVAAIYPFQGWEFAMTVVGVVFWLCWHVMQLSRESAELEEAAHKATKETTIAAIERY